MSDTDGQLQVSTLLWVSLQGWSSQWISWQMLARHSWRSRPMNTWTLCSATSVTLLNASPFRAPPRYDNRNRTAAWCTVLPGPVSYSSWLYNTSGVVTCSYQNNTKWTCHWAAAVCWYWSRLARRLPSPMNEWSNYDRRIWSPNIYLWSGALNKYAPFVRLCNTYISSDLNERQKAHIVCTTQQYKTRTTGSAWTDVKL